MTDFKRSSSRFSRGSSGSSSGAASAPQRGGSSGGGSRSYGGNSGGGQSQQRSAGRGNGGGGQGGGKEFPFTRIANLTIPKSAGDDLAAYIENELKGSEIKLNAQIYLGKGDNELTLKNGDQLFISFRTSDKDKDFVVGNISVKN